MDNCSVSAVRTSVIRVRNSIAVSKNKAKHEILQIIKDSKEEN